MTKEELQQELKCIDTDFKNETRAIKEKYNKKRYDALKKWADENASFQIGDMIEYEDQSRAIIVEKIYGESNYGEPYIVYYGQLLNRKHEIMKGYNGGSFTMYEPHSSYKLQKIENKK